jgi:hypothetical protein
MERQQAHEASDQTLQNDHPGAGPNYLDIPLDIRISRAAHQFLDGKFKSIKAAQKAWHIENYYALYHRVKGRKPRSQNGGHNRLIQEEEELSLLAWCNWRISIGM